MNPCCCGPERAVAPPDERVYFCGTVERLRRGAAVKWNKIDLTWSVAGTLPGLTEHQMLTCAQTAFDQWSKVTPLLFRYVGDGGGDIRMTVGRIDGPGGTLGWSYLPTGSDSPLLQKYDSGDRWQLPPLSEPNGRPTGQGFIDPLAVMTHEIGHALGLDHDSAPQGEALMNSYYLPGLRGLQDRDVRRIKALYPGESRLGKTPGGGPSGGGDPPAPGVVTVQAYGVSILVYPNGKIDVPGWDVRPK